MGISDNESVCGDFVVLFEVLTKNMLIVQHNREFFWEQTTIHIWFTVKLLEGFICTLILLWNHCLLFLIVHFMKKIYCITI